MMVRYVAFAMLGLSQAWAAAPALARATTLSRREIRQMPILERPSRPGHFYGNTVRRKAHVLSTNPWAPQ